MKRKIKFVASILLIITLAVTGCASKSENAQSSSSQEQSGTSQPETSTPSTEKNQKDMTIVAKSGSAQNSQDKEAVLDQITKELDDIVNSANSFDDIDDTDLK